MKHKIVSLTILILGLSFGSFTIAADNNINAACTNATVKGSYGFYRSGTTEDGQLAAAGIAFFDGNGHAQLRQNASINGTHGSVALSFEYSIAKDCTFKSSLDGNKLSAGVVVDNGNRMFLISMTEGHTINAVWEKIHKE